MKYGENHKRNLLSIYIGVAAGLIVFLILAVLMYNMENHEIPAGYIGYVYRNPILGSGEMFERTINGPGKTGFVWRRKVHIISTYLYKAKESFKIRTIDNLNVTVEVYGTFQVDQNKVKEIVENYGYDRIGSTTMPMWYMKLVSPILRATVRKTINKYDSNTVPAKRNEIATEIKALLSDFLTDRPIILHNIVISNVDFPTSVDNEIQMKLAAIQRKERLSIEIEATKLEAQKRIEESKGIAEANRIIDESLTPSYIQFEAVKVAGMLAGSDNTTFYFVPIGAMGMPVVLPLPDTDKKPIQINTTSTPAVKY